MGAQTTFFQQAGLTYFCKEQLYRRIFQGLILWNLQHSVSFVAFIVVCLFFSLCRLGFLIVWLICLVVFFGGGVGVVVVVVFLVGWLVILFVLFLVFVCVFCGWFNFSSWVTSPVFSTVFALLCATNMAKYVYVLYQHPNFIISW